MKTLRAFLCALCVNAAVSSAQSTREVHFYSENVQCYAKLFLPANFTESSKAAAVVLAPAWGQTESTLEQDAALIAAKGIVAMAIDYRGWGHSGGYIYLAEDVRFDDRLRFSQHTAKVRIRRKRLIPDDQIDDIRNAISYIQGEPGVDRARIGIWGRDMSAGHAIVIAGIDPRAKAIVAVNARIDGRDTPRKLGPDPYQATRIKLARADSAAAAKLSDEETKIAVAEYHPFWFVSQIPQTTAVLFLSPTADAEAAAKILKGPVDTAGDPAEWFAKHLQ